LKRGGAEAQRGEEEREGRGLEFVAEAGLGCFAFFFGEVDANRIYTETQI
jgi:hypothetical protein